jgi:glycosyltransferase involved in cell wall biosynthesis
MKRTVSYIHGLCVEHDAISGAIKNEVAWLQATSRYDVTFHGYRCDFAEVPFHAVNTPTDIVFDPRFQASDVVVFHFGVFYPLFNLLPVTPHKAKRVVVFHNVTPKALVPVANHPTIDKSFAQMANIVFADHVACDSQTNLDVLREADIQTPATVLPLAIRDDLNAPERKPSARDGIVRFVFVGRFVRSKGPGDLLAAFGGLLRSHPEQQCKLDMLGNISFSDNELMKEICSTIDALRRAHGERVSITLYGDATDATKKQLLSDADIFALPTYHEGFCVPILEALASGCKVVAYENSNTPAISGGLARLTPTGDVGSLTRAIAAAVAEVRSPEWADSGHGAYASYKRRAAQYVQFYAPEATQQRFIRFFNGIVDPYCLH